MGKRTWIDSEIWSDTEGLTSTELTFFVYLMTCDQRNIAGYYKVNISYMVSDLKMSKTKIEKLLLKEQKYWLYDPDTKQVLIPKFTRYNIVKSRQQIAKLNAELNKLKPCPLHKKFVESFVEVNGIGSEELLDDRFRRSIFS